MDDQERQFEQVAAEVAEPLHRFLLRRLPRDEVDDVLADAMLVLWRRLDQIPVDAVLPWAYGVARHCLANATRAERRRARLQVRVDGTPSTTPDEDASAEAAARRVHAALDHLTDDERELVRLWAWEDLAPREIGVVLGITSNAASIRLHRARRKIATLLEREDERSGTVPDMDG